MDKTAEQYVSGAIRYYNTGYYKDALTSCEQAILRDPTCARAYHGKGLVLIQRKLEDQALEAFRKASELAPENAKVHADMAELLFARRDYTNAGRAYKKAMEHDSKYRSAYAAKLKGLLDRAFELRNPYSREAAIYAFRQVLLFDPENEMALSELVKLQEIMETLRRGLPPVHYANCRCRECYEP